MKPHLFGGETKLLPVAAFFSPEMASDWINAALHRKQDIVIECEIRYQSPNTELKNAGPVTPDVREA